MDDLDLILVAWVATWFILSLLAGAYAGQLGHSPVVGFFVSLLASPLVAFVALLVIGRKAPSAASPVRQPSSESGRGSPMTRDEMRRALGPPGRKRL